MSIKCLIYYLQIKYLFYICISTLSFFTHSEDFHLFSLNSCLFLLLFMSSETNASEVSKALKSFIYYSVRLMENKFKIGLASETAES